jgi:hypothetical protein
MALTAKRLLIPLSWLLRDGLDDDSGIRKQCLALVLPVVLIAYKPR